MGGRGWMEEGPGRAGRTGTAASGRWGARRVVAPVGAVDTAQPEAGRAEPSRADCGGHSEW